MENSNMTFMHMIIHVLIKSKKLRQLFFAKCYLATNPLIHPKYFNLIKAESWEQSTHIIQTNHINHKRSVIFQYCWEKRSLYCPRSFCENKSHKQMFVLVHINNLWGHLHHLISEETFIFNVTCLYSMSFPWGNSFPFSRAMRVKVAIAFSLLPDSASKRGLSGNHFVTHKGRLEFVSSLFCYVYVLI